VFTFEENPGVEGDNLFKGYFSSSTPESKCISR